MRLIAICASADEKQLPLKQAPGAGKIEAYCGTCHSVDYIMMKFAISRCREVGCGSHQDDQIVRRSDRSSRRQDD
jgi:hypothetical protein